MKICITSLEKKNAPFYETLKGKAEGESLKEMKEKKKGL